MSQHDIVIRAGTLADGTGSPAEVGDVAIDGDRITAVGQDIGQGRREIDADGLLVTPGWVDIHAHYDAQATWDPMLSPSSEHGVTTVVLGNCGVGFAPAKESMRDELIELMEAVGLSNATEQEWGTDPENPDSDGDGIFDGAEVNQGSSPTDGGSRPSPPELEASARRLTFAAIAAGPAGAA